MADCMTTYENKVLVCEYKSNEIIEVSTENLALLKEEAEMLLKDGE